MTCPHTTNPIQLKELCKRCRRLDEFGIFVYKMPEQLGGDWAVSVESKLTISDGFKNKHDAEEWGLMLADGDVE